MSAKKRACVATTRTGRGCRAWAIIDSDPPLCSSHSGRAGAPPGNLNNYKHGFYSPALQEAEIADLLTYATNMTLHDELALTRVMLRRFMVYLNKEGEDVHAFDLSSVAPHVFTGIRTVAALLRQIESEGSQDIWSEVLDQMADILNVEL